METKVCKTCNTERPNDSKNFVTVGKYLSTECRTCRNARSKAWRDRQPRSCAYEGCTNRVHSRGYCINHYRQAFFAGSIPRKRFLPYKNTIGYDGLHQRIRFAKGHAANHPCEHWVTSPVVVGFRP